MKLKFTRVTQRFGSKDSNNTQNPPPCLRIPVPAIVTLFIGSGMKDFHNIFLSPAADQQLAASKRRSKEKSWNLRSMCSSQTLLGLLN